MKWPELVKWEETLSKARPNRSEFFELKDYADDDGVLRRFSNLRLLEGIPAAFSTAPWDYELVRDAIARRLDVPSHDLTLVGSARFGFSYTGSKWPKEFTAGSSDFDFLVCSGRLFGDCLRDAERFYQRAENDRDPSSWSKVVTEARRQFALGFINHDTLLPRPQNPTFRDLDATCTEVTERYERQLRFSKVKLRIYRDWDKAMARTIANLRSNLRLLKTK
jgi:hypothetical protein